ncbi:MAG: MazG family protein [Vampirovibrionales bacterium]|nr:MazG family protein [Vampirovibrionales bacterium]
MSAMVASTPHLPQTQRLLDIVAALRNPATGCPWDLKQTHHSLRPYMLEEAYEVIEAIDALEPLHTMASQEAQATVSDPASRSKTLEAASVAFCGELGDVLLQVVLHAQLQQEAGGFDFESVAGLLADKLVRRHPHVFGSKSSTLETPEQVSQQWQTIKASEARNQQTSEGFESLLGKTSQNGPSLSYALEISKKAVGLGFTWPNFDALWQCVQSEFSELAELLPPFEQTSLSEEQVRQQTQSQATLVEEELGDLLFATVNLARGLNINPELALAKAIRKFRRRFEAMEHRVSCQAQDGEEALEARKRAVIALSFEEWDTLWKQAKQSL